MQSNQGSAESKALGLHCVVHQQINPLHGPALHLSFVLSDVSLTEVPVLQSQSQRDKQRL